MKNFVDEYEDKKMTAEAMEELKQANMELQLHVRDLEEKIAMLKGEIHALVYAVRCNGVSGADVKWEDI